MSKIKVKHGESYLVWGNPRIVDRSAVPQLFPGFSVLPKEKNPVREGAEDVMEKFLETMEHAFYGNLDLDKLEKLEHIRQGLESLRIDMLNFDKVKARKQAAA